MNSPPSSFHQYFHQDPNQDIRFDFFYHFPLRYVINFAICRMSAPAGRGLSYLWKKGWNEIPEVMGSGLYAVAGVFLGSIGIYKYYARDGDNRRYKQFYVVMRPDDPRVAKIHKD